MVVLALRSASTFFGNGVAATGARLAMVGAPEFVFSPAKIEIEDGQAFIVREYGPADLGALVEMYAGFQPKRVAQGLPPPDVPRITRWLEELQYKSRSLLAAEGARVVAHAVLCPISNEAVEFTVFVHQDFRDRGLGTALTRLALNFAAEMGFTQVFLTTELSNYPALRLYKKVGFEIRSAYGDECEMQLDIVSAAKQERRAA
jgi:RimJ/RimL family protein N-acetyltransferase